MFGFVKKSTLEKAHSEIQEHVNKNIELTDSFNKLSKQYAELKKITLILGIAKESELKNYNQKNVILMQYIDELKINNDVLVNQLNTLNLAYKESISVTQSPEYIAFCEYKSIQSQIKKIKEQKDYLLEEQTKELKLIKDSIEKEISTRLDEKNKLIQSVAILNEQIESLNRELDSQDLIQTITPYQNLMDGPSSDDIKELLTGVKEKQKNLIKTKSAFTIINELVFNDSLSEGRAVQQRHAKFVITAFNAVADNLIANTNLTNFTSNAKKIEKWFDKANKNLDDSFAELNRNLLHLRLEEQRYFFEHKYKKDLEAEEQRYIRESIREEEKVKKEIESFVSAREKEEVAYKKEIEKALKEAESANKDAVDKLNAHIAELKIKLEKATTEKERAMSMAQLTRSGYVYVISNKGSFGEGVYKIGMTRRLEPMDRVKELGDASVPFYFDVHALIPSDDAPTLESQLHNKFSSRRVNKVNNRREFFRVSFEEIESALKELIETDFILIRDVESSQLQETKHLESMEVECV